MSYIRKHAELYVKHVTKRSHVITAVSRLFWNWGCDTDNIQSIHFSLIWPRAVSIIYRLGFSHCKHTASHWNSFSVKLLTCLLFSPVQVGPLLSSFALSNRIPGSLSPADALILNTVQTRKHWRCLNNLANYPWR